MSMWACGGEGVSVAVRGVWGCECAGCGGCGCVGMQGCGCSGVQGVGERRVLVFGCAVCIGLWGASV